jgi:hypothetical protein
MKELDCFLKVCKKIGIGTQTYRIDQDVLDQNEMVIGHAFYWTQISQAHFYFDKDKKFLCVKDDEMGNVYRREES